MGLNMIGYSIIVMALIIRASEAITEYKVGDSFGWNIPTNENFYSDWASTKNFFVGDKLVFNWTGTHTVGDVSKGDYDICNTAASSFGSNSNETVFRITLLQSGPRYFICTVGNHCSRGQKFNINVEPLNSDSPTAQSPDSSAPTHSFGILFAFLSCFALYLFNHDN